ncbi:hypothetical protein TKK_0015566 [Trichogramma kaykai]
MMDEQKNEIKEILKSVNHVCLTADVWSAPNRSFMGVTAQWMDKISLNRKSAALACRRFKGAHSHDRITELLLGINNTYNLSNDKIIGTVTDNGSNFVKAFGVFGTPCEVMDADDDRDAGSDSEVDDDEDIMDVADERTDSKDDDFDCSDIEQTLLETVTIPDECIILSQHFRCVSHTLNLIATTDAMKVIHSSSKLKRIHTSVISKCEVLWKSLKSVQKREKLKDYFGECLQKPNATRWNSLNSCLKQISKLKKKLIAPEISTILKKEIDLDDNDFVHIDHYLAIMEHLALAIDKLQGDEHCHYGQLIPSLITIEQRWLQKIPKMTSKSYKDFIEGMTGSLKKRFSDIFAIVGVGKIAAVATLSHPNFKKSWVKCLSLGTQANVEQLIQSNQQSAPNGTLPESTADDFYYFGESNEPTNLDKIIALKTNSSELLRFLAEPPSTSLLELNRFPRIKKLFLKYNTILPSSAPVERLFSYATMLNIPKYNRPSDSQFEKRLLFKVNNKKLYK